VSTTRSPEASHPFKEDVGMVEKWQQDEQWVQLATRIPKSLHRELKLHCVKADVKLMEFVVAALWAKLTKTTRKRAIRA
jgi:hypothetical protein